MSSVSFEALAMAGGDYNECGISVEEWERSETMTLPHLLAEEEEEREDHKSSGELVPVFFPPSSRNREEEEEEYCRKKYKGEKKLAIIKLVKQVSSKRMMIERIISPRETSDFTAKVEAGLWKNLLRVLMLEFKRMFSVE